MKASDSKVSKFIGGNEGVFIIPPFQRNYTWSKEQCNELFEDIISAIKKNKSHYIGNIVYYIGKNNTASFSEYVLIDGQQRITSILLLLCALKNQLSNEDYDKRVINKKYLLNEYDEERLRVKLKQTDNDDEIFEKIILGKTLLDEEKKSNLYTNYNFFIDKLEEYKNSISLKEIYNAIGNLDIVDLNLQIENDLEAVQKIFEKINSTGKPLSTADLIRNYLLITDNTEYQRHLYKTYWLQIEKLYTNKENISDFAKHYLITKRADWVEESKMYSTFKSYFDNMDIDKEEVLEEILHLSKFYNWFRDENAPDKNINIVLKELNILKSDDMYSLLLVFFDKLYDNSRHELYNILELLCDFMIRYRIVSPTNGSGDIRKTLYTLLSKMINEEIELTYNNILFELSNSPSPNGRFPDDKEFKEALKNKVNKSYAKALLYKLEYKLTKNIKVNIDEVTIEHILPQTLSIEWKEYLGGEEKATMIYNTYLNCIGNLTMLSGAYNSENSNKEWAYKRTILADAQFKLTKESSNYNKWDEKSITKRNQKLSDLAAAHITGPIERTTPFKITELNDESSLGKSGIYSIDDITFSVTGRTIKSLIYDKKPYNIKNWNELLPTVCKILYDIDSILFQEIINKNKIHKSSKNQSYYLGKDPIISYDKNSIVTAYNFEKAKCFIEMTLSADRAKFYTSEILNIYNMSQLFKIEIE